MLKKYFVFSLFLLGFVCNKQKYEMITIKQLIEDILTKFLDFEQLFIKDLKKTLLFEIKLYFLVFFYIFAF